MFYEENEILITTKDIGSEKKGTLIPEGSEVTFIKLVDNESDLAQSIVAFNYGGKIRISLESMIRPKNKKKIKAAHKEFNMNMIRHHPRTRRYYHPIFLMKYYFRVYYFFADMFGGKKMSKFKVGDKCIDNRTVLNEKK